MSKTVLVMLLAALVPAGAFAIDGQVLINQSTVMAQGGFPYVISTPGSYKLSGSLNLSTTPSGNYPGFGGVDIAIAINSSRVVLDLNGFSISVTNANASIGHRFYAIKELGVYAGISIVNGIINMESVPLTGPVGGLGFPINMTDSHHISMRDLVFFVPPQPATFNVFQLGHHSLVHHIILPGTGQEGLATCPSLLEDSVGGVNGIFGLAPCTFVNNAQ